MPKQKDERRPVVDVTLVNISKPMSQYIRTVYSPQVPPGRPLRAGERVGGWGDIFTVQFVYGCCPVWVPEGHDALPPSAAQDGPGFAGLGPSKLNPKRTFSSRDPPPPLHPTRPAPGRRDGQAGRLSVNNFGEPHHEDRAGALRDLLARWAALVRATKHDQMQVEDRRAWPQLPWQVQALEDMPVAVWLRRQF